MASKASDGVVMVDWLALLSHLLHLYVVLGHGVNIGAVFPEIRIKYRSFILQVQPSICLVLQL
jgi:hypothetical protein